MLQSTLECFFNQSCLDILISLTGALHNISPLNMAAPLSRFHPITTIGTIYENLMIESWQNTSDFAAYFHTCARRICTHSYVKRFVFVYMVTVLIGLFGGLNVTFRLVSPFIVKILLRFGHRTARAFEPVQAPGPRQGELELVLQSLRFDTIFLGVWHHLRNFLELIRHRTMAFNLFKKNSTDEQHGIYSTRLYCTLLMIGMSILVIFAATASDSQVITVRNPTIDQLEELNRLYPSTLSCPCQQLSMPRSTFMCVEARFHPFCTSTFVREGGWLQYWPMRFLNGSVDPRPPFPQLR